MIITTIFSHFNFMPYFYALQVQYTYMHAYRKRVWFMVEAFVLNVLNYRRSNV